jgi:hypothetical protein
VGWLAGGVALCVAPMWFEWLDASGPHAFAPLVASVVVTVLATVLPRSRRSSLAVFAYAIAIAAAVIAVVRAPSGDVGLRVVWVPIFALLYVLVAALAQSQWASRDKLGDLRVSAAPRLRFRFTTAAILVASQLAFIQRAQDATVHQSWRTRWRAWIENASEVAVASAAPVVRDPYAPLLAHVPADSSVLVWVAHPERIDFARHRAFDLRVPRHSDLREYSLLRHGSPLARLVRSTGAHFLLFEPDMDYRQRAMDFFGYALWCTAANRFADPALGMPAGCADPLERALVDHPIVAAADGVVLVDLDHDR